MSKHYTYIMTNTSKTHLHCGYCKDVYRMQKFYKEMPSMHFLYENYSNNILVYLEELPNLDSVRVRLDQLMGLNREQKTGLINSINPDWVEIIPGVNVEL
jgi:putative endonuclease